MIVRVLDDTLVLWCLAACLHFRCCDGFCLVCACLTTLEVNFRPLEVWDFYRIGSKFWEIMLDQGGVQAVDHCNARIK